MATANIYYFNPTCELAVANGSFSYQPPLLLQEMETDLSILPLVFCTKNDFLLTENSPSVDFSHQLKTFGFELPQFCSLAQLESLPDGSFDAVHPWGWSPAAHFKLKSLKERCDEKFRKGPGGNWTDEHKVLFERSTSLNFLNDILDDNLPDWMIRKEITGKKVIRCEEIEMLLSQHSPLVLKAPLSSSGRGIQIIRNSSLNTSNRQWISGVFKQQNYLIAEPFLEKLTDMSFQFRILSDGTIEYLGFSIFETNSNGQYRGTLINPDLNKLLPNENASELIEMISSTAYLITNALAKSVYARLHRGFLGVDAMLFKDQKRVMMQPCIEVNSRMNMGILALNLEKRVHPASTGKFELFYDPATRYQEFSTRQVLLYPPEIKDGKLYSGFFPLIEPGIRNKFGAYITLGSAK